MIPGARATQELPYTTVTATSLWGLAVVGFGDFGFAGGGSNGWTYNTTITGLTPETARVRSLRRYSCWALGCWQLATTHDVKYARPSADRAGVFISLTNGVS